MKNHTTLVERWYEKSYSQNNLHPVKTLLRLCEQGESNYIQVTIKEKVMKDNKDDKLDNKKRKIEFRWWNKLYNKMFYSYRELYDFIEDMEENNEELFDKDEGFCKDEIYTYNYALNLDFDIEENSNCIPMQFTGLCDKDGKKIYEGDIVRVFSDCDGFYIEKEYIYGVVVYEDEFGFGYEISFNHIRNSCDEYLGNHRDNIEVMGNVWDNPELLGGSDEKCDN